MDAHFLLIAVVVYSLCREVFFMYNTQKLVNKLMSRNYYDFQISKDAGKIKGSPFPPLKDDDGMDEDLGVLSGFTP